MVFWWLVLLRAIVVPAADSGSPAVVPPDMPPLLTAIDTGQPEAALQLIGAGKGVNETWNGLSPLGLAVFRGQTRVVKELLARGAKANGSVAGAGLDLTRTWDARLPAYKRLGRRIVPEVVGVSTVELPIVVLAAMQPDVETMRLVLDKGGDPNSYNADPQTGVKNYALAHAAGRGYLPIVELLLQKGCDSVEALDAAVELSSRRGEIECSEVLLGVQERRRFKPDPLSEGLIDAAGRGDYAQVQALIFKGAKINYTNQYGVSPLISAVVGKQTEIVKWLLQNKADYHANPRAGFHLMPLHQAIVDGNTGIFNLLLPLDYTKAELDEALLQAVLRGSAGMAKQLLERGASPNTRDTQGVSVLAHAQNLVFDEVVSLLKAAGGQAVLPAGVLLESPLFAAAGRGDPQRVQLLLARGLDPDGGKKGGVTPLSELVTGDATPSNRLAIAEMLFKAGAGAHCIESRWNPMPILCQVIKTEDPDLLRLFVKQGASPNEFSYDGGTVLHQAVRAKSAVMVQTLLELGANRNARDDKGQTPLDIANGMSQSRIADLLKKGIQ